MTLKWMPAPSPNGTNHSGKRLYIINGPRVATMAMDAALPDDLPDDSAFEELHQLLSANLSPEDLGKAESLLTHLLDKTAADGADEPPMAAGGKERLNYGQR